MKDYEKIGDHTIKKFELVSEYAKGWAHKILGYSQSAGLIYIDCMCNCGKYYDNNGNIVEGTAIRVARIINQINASHQKEAILHFNDLDKGKILHLKSVIDMMDLQHVKIYYHSTDANELLGLLAKSDLEKHNTLLFYDPYQADIDWNALEPFFNTWGEVIINHMVSDVIRGAKNVNNPEKIAKYEKTYHKSIDEIIKTSNAPNNREEFEKIANSIIESCVYQNSKKYYILGLINDRFIYKYNKTDEDLRRKKEERIKLNRNNYQFQDEEFIIICNKMPRNIIEHLDERNVKTMLASSGVGGFNVIFEDSDSNMVAAIKSNRKLYPYNLDLKNKKVLFYNIQAKLEEEKKIDIDILKLQGELKKLEKNVNDFAVFLKR